ncbi:hemerythrin family protein [sulfur-oxidizing endosymbiont of Gigantopelta aegis]|uniref:hemerythrin family protein n=1 Tax=sulfur-oxidizing endosymbiont of Gigantopelta aegis TaxID=2794934 RepID=UPI0018DB0EB8|nr:hemerythrin family protein [sulfur-oxidizing endosymbiont of Gigantopelta aegis]
MKKRGIGQTISWYFAIFCYAMSLLTIAFATYWQTEHGTQDPIFAGALASIFFFGSCGFVLHYIAKANLPDYNLSK